MLACLSENQGPFRAVAKNPSCSLTLSPASIRSPSMPRSYGRGYGHWWKRYLARLAKLTQDFGTAVSRQQGTGDLSDAAKAAIAGRIGTLLIDADQVQPGTIDPTTGAIKAKDLADPKVDDKLDDLGELVLKTGGQVVIVPTERMPTKTGLAAIFRYWREILPDLDEPRP